jgi:hypothetical protein
MIASTNIEPDDLLRELFVGASIIGIRFGALQLLCSPPTDAGELFINLSSAFQVFDARPSAFPVSESGVPDQSQEEEILSLFALRALEITQVEVVEPAGHLVVTFANGTVLYVNGNNPGPEPWAAGLNAIDRADSVWVIAVSGARRFAYKPFASGSELFF